VRNRGWRLIKGLSIHYGWIILAAGTLGSFMTLPGQTAGVSVFFDPVTQELGISRTWASIAYSCQLMLWWLRV